MSKHQQEAIPIKELPAFSSKANEAFGNTGRERVEEVAERVRNALVDSDDMIPAMLEMATKEAGPEEVSPLLARTMPEVTKDVVENYDLDTIKLGAVTWMIEEWWKDIMTYSLQDQTEAFEQGRVLLPGKGSTTPHFDYRLDPLLNIRQFSLQLIDAYHERLDDWMQGTLQNSKQFPLILKIIMEGLQKTPEVMPLLEVFDLSGEGEPVEQMKEIICKLAIEMMTNSIRKGIGAGVNDFSLMFSGIANDYTQKYEQPIPLERAQGIIRRSNGLPATIARLGDASVVTDACSVRSSHLPYRLRGSNGREALSLETRVRELTFFVADLWKASEDKDSFEAELSEKVTALYPEEHPDTQKQIIDHIAKSLWHKGQKKEIDPAFHGCPSRFAHGIQEGKSVFSESFHYFMNMFLLYYREILVLQTPPNKSWTWDMNRWLKP